MLSLKIPTDLLEMSESELSDLKRNLKLSDEKNKQKVATRISNGKEIANLMIEGSEEGVFSLQEGTLTLEWKGSGTKRTTTLDTFGVSCDCPDIMPFCKHKIALLLIVEVLKKRNPF